jgi:MFS family permease
MERYAFGFQPIRALLLLLAVVSMASMPLSVLMPVFATEVLHGGAATLGLLTAAMGVGALAGALLLATRKTVLGLAVILCSLSNITGLSLALLALSGFFMMMETAATNTILQTIVEEDKRGRVMSLYATAFVGMAPLGSLLAGSLASHIGAAHTVQLAGALCVVASLWFARQLRTLRKFVRPLYRRMGILPQAASGIPAVPGPPLDLS